MAPARDDYVSASELADYAYCPRSFWYHRHPPARGPSAASQRRSAEGVRYHARVLGAERSRAEHGAAYAALVVVGLLVLAVGVLWIFHLF
jgi:hypothetical protein